MIRLVALVIFALAAPSPGQAPKLDAKTLQVLQPVMKRHPFVAFAALARDEDDATLNAWTKKLSPAMRQALTTSALVGLKHPDPTVVYGAVSLLREWMLDVSAIEQYQKVVAPMVLGRIAGKGISYERLGNLVEWDDYKHTASRSDVEALLRQTPNWKSELRHHYLRDLHRSMRPEHLPALCALTRHQDPVVRNQAHWLVCLLAQHTEQHRELIGRTLLAWRGRPTFDDLAAKSADQVALYKPLPVKLSEKVGGYPAVLVALLERSLQEKMPRGPNRQWPDNWLTRWVARAKAAPSDLPLLQRMLKSEDYLTKRMALIGLRPFRGKKTQARLIAHYDKTKDTVEKALCAMTLAEANVVGWRERLHAASRDSDTMLVASLQVMPKLTVDDWAARAMREGAAQATEIKQMREALAWPLTGPFRLPATTRQLIYQVIDERAPLLSAVALRQLIRQIPGCRSNKVAVAYRQNLRTGDDVRECELAFLEVSDRAATRQRLVSLLANKNLRDPALDALMRLGDIEHAAAIAKRWPFQKNLDLHVLARCGKSSAVRAFLAKRVRAIQVVAGAKFDEDTFESFAALAMAHGLSETVSRNWSVAIASEPVDRLTKHWTAWRDMVLNGRPVDALAAFLGEQPRIDLDFTGVGMVKDQRVTQALRHLRARPGCRVQWVIGELALAGDAEAKATMQVVRDRAYYGWADDAPAIHLNQGRSLASAKYWIEEIETNCCRRVAAGQALEDLCGYDPMRIGSLALCTQADGARAWWREFAPRLKWSRVAQRFVIGPR